VLIALPKRPLFLNAFICFCISAPLAIAAFAAVTAGSSGIVVVVVSPVAAGFG
jgi:hypothetical protein